MSEYCRLIPIPTQTTQPWWPWVHAPHYSGICGDTWEKSYNRSWSKISALTFSLLWYSQHMTQTSFVLSVWERVSEPGRKLVVFGLDDRETPVEKRHLTKCTTVPQYDIPFRIPRVVPTQTSTGLDDISAETRSLVINRSQALLTRKSYPGSLTL